MAFIQGSVVCLRKTMRASFQTAAFATSTIVQMKAQTNARAPMLPVNPCAKLVQTSIRCYS